MTDCQSLATIIFLFRALGVAIPVQKRAVRLKSSLSARLFAGCCAGTGVHFVPEPNRDERRGNMTEVSVNSAVI
jgi:hypothetical protein